MKKIVKVVLVIASILTLISIDNKITEGAVNSCVSAGHSYDYCMNGLR